MAALDAYAVVTLLPQMLGAVEVPIDQLQAAAPIVSGFLGGYVVAMPLLGAYSDARGRLPAFAAGLAVFAAGSALTALAPALGWLIAGRALQGLGGGALVPLTLALAADLYGGRRRGTAIGAVAAVQEAGSVIGPLYGSWLAAAPGGWRTVFWLDIPLAALLLAGLWVAGRRRPAVPDATTGAPAGRGQVDWPGALLLGLALGLLVLALYPDDVTRRPVNENVLPFGAAAAAAFAGFAWSQRGRLRPLVGPALIRRRSFWVAMAANFLAGVALMVALVDIPVLARGVFRLSTLDSGLVLARLLLGVPVGALAGGWLSGRLGRRWTAAAGLLIAGGGFALMSGWGLDELHSSGATAAVELFGCGFGFGLVIAPLATGVIELAGETEHGLASSLIVLVRTVGMIVGLAALTAFGLGRLTRILSQRQCGVNPGGGSLQQQLAAYEDCVRGALLQEYREVFLVAVAICVLGAAVVAWGLGAGGGLSLPTARRAAVRE